MTFPFPSITNPLTFRARAALEAAGAWDPTPLEIAVPGHGRATFYIEYTRAAAGGAVDFQMVVSPYAANLAGVEDWFMQTQYSGAVLAAGSDSQGRIQREYLTYASTAAGAENFVYGPVELGAGVERLRIRCRESGAVANPGTCHIVGIVFDEQA